MEPCLVPDVTAAPMTTPIPPLGSTVLRGLVWLGGVRWAAQLFTWGSTLVIARLLAPEDYGLVALGTVLTGFLEVITDLGLGSALVQRQDLTKRDIEATMGVTCALGAGAAVLVALSASLWARLQGDPRIVSIVQSLAVGVLLTTAGAVPYSMLHRRLAFGLVARAQLVRGLVTAAATLILAFVLQSYWALVVGYLVGKALFTLMLIWAEPVRPGRPGPDTKVGELLRFGGILTADRVLNYARNNLDIILVGALLGPHMVGLYVMALALARLPFEKLGSAFEPVAYPTFARLQSDAPGLRRYFLGLSLGTAAIALPGCLGLIVTANVLVPAIIGSQWTAVVRPLQVAALATPLIFHLGLVTALFNAAGRVDLSLRITTITSLLTILAVFLSVQFGITAVAAASGIAFALPWAYAEFLALRRIDLHWREVTRTLFPALSASVGMAAAVYAVSLLLPLGWTNLARLAVEVSLGLVAYVSWALVLHRNMVVGQLRSLRAAWRPS